MDCLEYNFTFYPLQPWKDILIAYFNESFESFVETETGFLGYISEDKNKDVVTNTLNKDIFKSINIEYQCKKIINKNWNEEWEKKFQPIIIDNKIYIRAEFHPKCKDVEYEIIIQPKMSFGTGHHATTFLMLKIMYDIPFIQKKVLDMGCGTAILAIFAKMRGASYTEAIDIDEWAYNNALENIIRNKVDVTIKKGDVHILENHFDIILANINKNILIHDIPFYIKYLNNEGILLLSGILMKNLEEVLTICTKNGLIFMKKEEKNNWISILLRK